MSSPFSQLIQDAKVSYDKPQRVDTVESQLSKDLATRLKTSRLSGSLADRVKARRLAMGYKSQGLDTVLDITPLDQGEFIIFCRKLSLLQTKIDFRRQGRTAEELVAAILKRSTTGFCKQCFEATKSCLCDQI